MPLRKRAATMAAALAALLAVAGPAAPSQAEEKALVAFKVMTPKTALILARATIEACRKAGYQVAVVVTDRFGGVQVALRDRLAGAHTVETARRKAWSAVSFRTDTWEVYRLIEDGSLNPGIRQIDQALFVGGGVRVTAAGSIVGGVGVSGAPGGKLDHDCAVEGIEAIHDIVRLKFCE
ncbi:MAG: heme-binding protein [Rhodospirillaceae bacterium]|nr:heme-binding protein [Rhodospirillaceae bacterium]